MSCAGLWYNEGMAVQTATSLEEGLDKIVLVKDRLSASEMKQLDGKLIHLIGKQKGSELSDKDFNVKASDSVGLRRDVQMYQWKETEHTREAEEWDHRGHKQVVTYKEYSYRPKWSSTLIDSRDFHQPDRAYPPNPDRFPVEAVTHRPPRVEVGLYTLSKGLMEQMDNWEEVEARALPNARAIGMGNYQLQQGQRGEIVAKTGQRAQPEIGDVRIRFKHLPASVVSVIAEVRQGKLLPHQTAAGDQLEMLSLGSISAKQMFEDAQAANTARTWALRFAGVFVLFCAFSCVLSPLSAIAYQIPLMGGLAGGLVGAGAMCASLLLAVSVGSLVMSVSWFWYRPLLSVALLVGAAIPLIYLSRQQQQQQQQQQRQAQ